MCLIALAYKQHPNYPFLLSANRDEFYKRPARAAHYWEEHPQLLAGRDIEAGGTWLGMTTSGKFAAITNYREEGSAGKTYPLSRGELSLNFLTGNQSAEAFLEGIRANDKSYAGFNLLLMDGTGLFCYSNRDSSIMALEPGLYGLSNHQIDTPWPKVKRAKYCFEETLKHNEISHDQLFLTICDSSPVEEDELPEINFDMDIDWAKQVSAQFIKSEDYGTRASTTILINKEGQVQFRERNFLANGQQGEQRDYCFTIK
jgi:uncharacterized protein with NRDE domain